LQRLGGCCEVGFDESCSAELSRRVDREGMVVNIGKDNGMSHPRILHLLFGDEGEMGGEIEEVFLRKGIGRRGRYGGDRRRDWCDGGRVWEILVDQARKGTRDREDRMCDRLEVDDAQAGWSS
jgi:hypothetical protein